MDDIVNKSGSAEQQSEDVMGIGKGSWIAEEDTIPVNYITNHGEGRWNPIARTESLNVTGESCKLRWLNYLRPDVNRGNITLQEQMFILQLYCRWGNRWSKIAQYLPGRTKNEIKNYWRTRVTKQAKQLKCSVNSEQFRYTLRYVWIPRLLGRIQVASQSRFPNWTQVEHSGWSLNAERLPERTDNKKENHRHSNVEEQLAGKEKAFEFNGRPDNNLKCLWPLFTETSDDEDEDGRSESKSHEYSGPS